MINILEYNQHITNIVNRYDPEHDIDPGHVVTSYSDMELLSIIKNLIGYIESLEIRIWYLEHPNFHPIIKEEE